MTIPLAVLIVTGVLAVAAIVLSNILGHIEGVRSMEVELKYEEGRLRLCRGQMAQLKRDTLMAQHKATACIAESRFWKRTARDLGWVRAPRSQPKPENVEVTRIREIPPVNDA